MNRVTLILGLLFLAGCGQKLQYAEVDGIVTLNGKVMEHVEVRFVPDHTSGGKGPCASGTTSKEGRYQLTSDAERAGGRQRPGVVAGWHRVVLVDVAAFAGKAPRRIGDEEVIPPSRIPPRYQDAVNTPLKFEVKPGQKQTIDLKL